MTTLLNSYINNEQFFNTDTYSIKSIAAVLNLLDNPHDKFSVIHIAGTNGKGSTARFLHSILTEENYCCGLFTSPHLVNVTERIQVNDFTITEDQINAYIHKIKAVAEHRLTYFDVLTVIAFLFFHENNVDCAVIETGLGGRKDSTNVVSPILSIITEISIDHMNILGNSLTAIAGEKAGIIKNNVPVISSNKNHEVENIIHATAKKLCCEYFLIDESFYSIQQSELSETHFSYHNNGLTLSKLSIQSPLKHQVKNSVTAIKACLVLQKKGFHISEQSIIRGLKKCRLPGRFSILLEKPLIIFDPAHNEASISSIVDYLTEFHPQKKLTIIMSLMSDKDSNAIFAYLQEKQVSILYVNSPDSRGLQIKSAPIKKMSIINSWDDISIKPAEHSIYLICGTFRIYDKALTVSEKIKAFFREKILE